MNLYSSRWHCIASALVALCLTAYAGQAQQHVAPTAGELLGDIHQLKPVACVLYVAAHPDDENTRLLAWLAKGQHVRTVYLSLTRGDGGQNILGPELGPALGLIRTHELMAARELDGAEQLFTRAIDFGFSKSADETFTHWGRIELIADVVRAIRNVRPDVMICRFPKDSMAGHGQHSASAIIAEQAFDYCHGTLKLSRADQHRLDSMLSTGDAESRRQWSPQRLLFNAYRFGSRSTIVDTMFMLTVGQYDPLLGMGYGELAGISRSLHRSQGAGTPSVPGTADEYFATLRGTPPTRTLFDGVATTWSRIGLPEVDAMLDTIIANHQAEHPERSLDALLRLNRKLHSVNPRTVADTTWLEFKKRTLESVILGCMGLVADLTVPGTTARAGDHLQAQLRVTQRSGAKVSVTEMVWSNGRLPVNLECSHDVLGKHDVNVAIPTTATATSPYWLEAEPSHDCYSIADNALLRSPVSSAAVPVRLTMVRGIDTLTLSLNLSSKRLDPVHGDVIEALRVVPPSSVQPISGVVRTTNDTATVSVRVHAFSPLTDATIRVEQGGHLLGQALGVSLGENSDTVVHLAIRHATTGVATVACVNGNVVVKRTLHEIHYSHLPTLQYLETAQVHIIADPIGCTAHTVGYVHGAGDGTAEALRTLGVKVVDLDDEHLVDPALLQGYDAIVVGIRAINTRPSMKYIMPVLLAYVQHGGTLVMQYNTTQELSTDQLGPWPLPISRNRVTEEDAVVTILNPQDRLLTYPNTISQADFSGWVQERGLYFPSGYDVQYKAPLSMADRGEQAQQGSLLHAPYGKGHFVYCALSLFRQLPVGVVGGYRLLANMVSMSK